MDEKKRDAIVPRREASVDPLDETRVARRIEVLECMPTGRSTEPSESLALRRAEEVSSAYGAADHDEPCADAAIDDGARGNDELAKPLRRVQESKVRDDWYVWVEAKYLLVRVTLPRMKASEV